MQKHVASDGCMHGLCVDFENRSLHISDTRKLWIVVSLTAAYNNSMTAQQLQYDCTRRICTTRHMCRARRAEHSTKQCRARSRRTRSQGPDDP